MFSFGSENPLCIANSDDTSKTNFFIDRRKDFQTNSNLADLISKYETKRTDSLEASKNGGVGLVFGLDPKLPLFTKFAEDIQAKMQIPNGPLITIPFKPLTQNDKMILFVNAQAPYTDVYPDAERFIDSDPVPLEFYFHPHPCHSVGHLHMHALPSNFRTSHLHDAKNVPVDTVIKVLTDEQSFIKNQPPLRSSFGKKRKSKHLLKQVKMDLLFLGKKV